MSNAPQSEKKIIVDEDWKSQVEAERRAAQQQAQQAAAETAPAAAPAGEAQRAAETAGQELPPPDLTFLASTLYLQAMVSLGLLPNPVAHEAKVNLPQAKHAIDTLQMLFDKTAGNRTSEETAALDGMLHDLRMSFLAVSERK